MKSKKGATADTGTDGGTGRQGTWLEHSATQSVLSGSLYGSVIIFSAHPQLLSELSEVCALQSAPSAHPDIDDEVNDDEDEDDDLFAPKRRDLGSGADGSSLDAPDSSRVALDDSLLTEWGEPGRTERLRNRFVSGEL